MARERDWIPLPMCDLERRPWSLDRNPAWLMTRLQLYEMLSRNPCRTVLAFLICRNCEMNASWTSKVLHIDSNRKLVKIPIKATKGSSYTEEVFHVQWQSHDRRTYRGTLSFFIQWQGLQKVSQSWQYWLGRGVFHGQGFSSYLILLS